MTASGPQEHIANEAMEINSINFKNKDNSVPLAAVIGAARDLEVRV